MKNSDSNNELNSSLLNTRSLNNKSLHIFNLLTSSSNDFLGLTETWREDATSPSSLPAYPLSYSFVELARSPTKPFSSPPMVAFLCSINLHFLLLTFIISLTLHLNVYFHHSNLLLISILL